MNAYILHGDTSHSGRGFTHEQFKIEFAKGLLMSVAVNTIEDMPRATGPAAWSLPPPARLSERHCPRKFTDTKSGKQRQTNCIVCSGKNGRGRRTTTYTCKATFLCYRYDLTITYCSAPASLISSLNFDTSIIACTDVCALTKKYALNIRQHLQPA